MHTARWKSLGGTGDHRTFRAICGKIPCPGSLGILSKHGVGFDDPDAMLDEMAESVETALRLLRDEVGQLGSGPATTSQRRRLTEFEADLEKRLATFRGQTPEGERLVNDLYDTAAIIRVKGARWAMAPDDRGFKFSAPRARRPMPIYHGFPDTGYRISFGGKRNRDGWRIARRPWTGPAIVENSYPWDAAGQRPQPPCIIVCPVCGSHNEVPLPKGVES